MSIKGIFFKNQLLGAQGLGAFGASSLTDGILTGCEVTISGGTATMAPGYIIAGGRVFRLTTATPVGNIGSHFSAIVAHIDLTAASSDTEFSQVTLSMETGSNLPAVMLGSSSDINNGGTSYQAWIWLYDAFGDVKETYRHAKSNGKTLLWQNVTDGGSSNVGNGFAAQAVILPGMDGFKSFEITFATKASEQTMVTRTFVVPADVFLETNTDSTSRFYTKKYAHFKAETIQTSSSSWEGRLFERVVNIYPTEHAIEFATGNYSYPHHPDSSDYHGSGSTYMVPVEIYGVN